MNKHQDKSEYSSIAISNVLVGNWKEDKLNKYSFIFNYLLHLTPSFLEAVKLAREKAGIACEWLSDKDFSSPKDFFEYAQDKYSSNELATDEVNQLLRQYQLNEEWKLPLLVVLFSNVLAAPPGASPFRLVPATDKPSLYNLSHRFDKPYIQLTHQASVSELIDWARSKANVLNQEFATLPPKPPTSQMNPQTLILGHIAWIHKHQGLKPLDTAKWFKKLPKGDDDENWDVLEYLDYPSNKDVSNALASFESALENFEKKFSEQPN
jgi:hypothetical protein